MAPERDRPALSTAPLPQTISRYKSIEAFGLIAGRQDMIIVALAEASAAPLETAQRQAITGYRSYLVA